MKKGTINILTLVLCLMNIVLTSVIVFAVVPAMNSTTALVNKIASAIDLEKEAKQQYTDGISIDSVKSYSFEEKMTITLKADANGKASYAQFSVVMTLNTEDENYEKYEGTLSDNEKLMRSTVEDVVKQYTASELNNNIEIIEEEVTEALRKMYNETEFIYDVSLSDLVTQQ